MNVAGRNTSLSVRAVLLFGLVCGVAGGCTPWPEEGTGGIAERSSLDNVEIARLELRLDDCIARGARHSYAAQTAEAELQVVRVRRLWTAGFAEDYVRSFEILNVLVSDIEVHTRPLPLKSPSAMRRKLG